MPARLVSVEVYVAEAKRLRRERAAAARTGVACPGGKGRPCGRELQKIRPPQTVPGDEMIWFRCACPRCGKAVWLPE